MRPLGPNAPAPRRRRPRRRTERARLDRTLARPARCSRGRVRRLSARRIARPARLGRHRAADRRAARPRPGTGSHGHVARIPRGPPAVRTGGARRGRAATLLQWAVVASSATGFGIGSLSHRLRRPIERAWPLFHVAQLCGLDPSIVEQWTPRHVAELESELRQLDGVRRRRILHQAFERAIRHRLYDALMHHTPQAASAAAGVPGDFLHRRAGGIVSPAPGGGRAGLRDVQHRRLLQRGDVSPGRDRRASAAALPRGHSSRPLRRRNRGRRPSPRCNARGDCTGAPPASSATTCIWEAGCRCAAPC